MVSPKFGGRVRGSSTGRPIMVLLDAIGRRWALRVLWELRAGDELTFRALRAACADVSPSVLNERLAELRELGLVEAGPTGYRLTEDGAGLSSLLAPLDAWAGRWSAHSRRAPRTQTRRRGCRLA
jgi:DNA-binding HxlR family transcriptional regulator